MEFALITFYFFILCFGLEHGLNKLQEHIDERLIDLECKLLSKKDDSFQDL